MTIRQGVGPLTDSGQRLYAPDPAASMGADCHARLHQRRRLQPRLIGASNATYLISSSSNLTDWVPLQTNVSPTGLSTFSDTATNSGARAYRVQTPP